MIELRCGRQVTGDLRAAGEREWLVGIRVDDDGLLTQGAPGWALTWMDARVDGVPVTAAARSAVAACRPLLTSPSRVGSTPG